MTNLRNGNYVLYLLVTYCVAPYIFLFDSYRLFAIILVNFA